MPPPSPEALGERAVRLGLITDLQLREVLASFGTTPPTLDSFLQGLVRRDLVTNYLVDRLLKGETTGFFFGDYKVLYLVGTGTFARVFRAVNRVTNQVVAIKVLRNRFSDTPGQYRLFLREGELGLSLRHPNIVQMYAVHSVGNMHYLVMEFIEGRSLRDFARVRKIVKPTEATRLMLDICRGLDYAFQRAVTHRDLRMSNVLVSSKGQAKLVDFGLATSDEALNEAIDFEAPSTRTIDYAALERATGVRKDDLRSDIYFAGCLYYHLLTGIPPLVETKNRAQRLNRSRFTSIAPIQDVIPSLPHYLVSVLNRAMALDPNKRYQSPGDMLAELETVLARLDEEYKNKEEPSQEVRKPNGRPTEVETSVGTVQDKEPTSKEQHTVMIVESNVKMQDIFREGLKKAGFRALVTGNPDWAFERMAQNLGSIDCVVLNAQEVGEAALDTFNRLDDDTATQGIPAILLLDQNQRLWKKKASTRKHRVVVKMPVSLKQLIATINELIPLAEGFAASA